MPVTLEAAKQNTTDDLDLAIINEFQISSLLDRLTFDDAVNPAGGGATLTYTYRRETSLAEAHFRAINTEYTPAQLEPTTRHQVDLTPLGGTFQIDRVLANIGPVATNELTRNMSALIAATRGKFADTFINGDKSAEANAFDGLSKILTGMSTESTAPDGVDLTGPMDQKKAYGLIDLLDELVDRVEGNGPRVIIANKNFINKARSALRYVNQFTTKVGPLHQERMYYGDIELVDAGRAAGDNHQIIKNETAKGTDVYVVRFGLDGVHGVSMAGAPLIRHWLPDFTNVNAVQTGGVELGPVAIAVKATKSAAVMRGVKI
ncbi:major capsid protein [Actinotignum sp. GS-2025e]|uniref:major capsid protein n=1 Tax=unclassified Actinotignum TaxID=2632702 RepID=UPI003F46D844